MTKPILLIENPLMVETTPISVWVGFMLVSSEYILTVAQPGEVRQLGKGTVGSRPGSKSHPTRLRRWTCGSPESQHQRDRQHMKLANGISDVRVTDLWPGKTRGICQWSSHKKQNQEKKLFTSNRYPSDFPQFHGLRSGWIHRSHKLL